MSAVNHGTAEAHIALVRAMTETEPQEILKAKNDLEKIKGTISKSLKEYEATIYVEEDKAMFKELSTARQNYITARDKVLNALESGQKEAALNILNKEASPAFDAYMENTDKMLSWNLEKREEFRGKIGWANKTWKSFNYHCFDIGNYFWTYSFDIDWRKYQSGIEKIYRIS